VCFPRCQSAILVIRHAFDSRRNYVVCDPRPRANANVNWFSTCKARRSKPTGDQYLDGFRVLSKCPRPKRIEECPGADVSVTARSVGPEKVYDSLLELLLGEPALHPLQLHRVSETLHMILQFEHHQCLALFIPVGTDSFEDSRGCAQIPKGLLCFSCISLSQQCISPSPPLVQRTSVPHSSQMLKIVGQGHHLPLHRRNEYGA